MAKSKGRAVLTSSYLGDKKDPINAFELDPTFVQKYVNRKPDFGMNGLGEIVYYRTYSRMIAGKNEQWYQTCKRVIEGTFNMQKAHIQREVLGWNDAEAQKEAQDAYERMFAFKWLPPGRGIWAMGTAITEKKHLYASLNNCAFVSTDSMVNYPAMPFEFLMDHMMLGVGVGFDLAGAELKIQVLGFDKKLDPETFVIPDTREGWVISVKRLINAFVTSDAELVMDYSKIRPEGEPLKNFGGKASGPEPLKRLHKCIIEQLERCIGLGYVDGEAILNIMNLIGIEIMTGNVRRGAEIAFAKNTDSKFMRMKDYEENPHRARYGWASNNSIFAELGQDYSEAAEQLVANGEPGFAWLENMQKYGRMGDPPNYKDKRARGGNPCNEQTLESFELCTLVETFPSKHDSLEDYIETLKCAFMYAKTVTLANTHWVESNRVMKRNRRIGCSMSGIADFLANHSLDEFKKWCNIGYEKICELDTFYSEWFAVPESIKKTSIKPSGTVSLLAGVAAGMHYPISRFYIRRVRIAKNHSLIPMLRAANYYMEPAENDDRTLVVDFLIDAGEGVRTADQVSMYEQLNLAAFLQREYTDNQVSCTITFDPETDGPHIANVLDYYQYQLKCVSFLPKIETKVLTIEDFQREQRIANNEALPTDIEDQRLFKLNSKGSKMYNQLPYEPIDEALYRYRIKDIQPLDFKHMNGSADAVVERYCDGDTCSF